MPDREPYAVVVQDLEKRFGSFVAVNRVSLQVKTGEIFGFLGPNGAGKSTTMKLLTGFMAPSAGSARIGGYDVSTDRLKAAEILGYLPENGPLYLEMSPAEILKFLGAARGMNPGPLKDRLEYVADRCSLKGVWGKPISKLSKGYRQRVGMAQALLHDPQVLILDEPTSGLDPNQTHDVRELILSLAKTKTVLLSTHILQEVRAVCSRVILINNGRLVLDGTVDDFEQGRDMEERFRELTCGRQ